MAKIILITNNYSEAENTPFTIVINNNVIIIDETVDAFQNGRHEYIDKYNISVLPCILKIDDTDPNNPIKVDEESNINNIADFKSRNNL